MSTRSLIAHPTGNTLQYVYCHSDGYPAWNGRLLLRHHNSATAAAVLCSRNFGGLARDGKPDRYPESDPDAAPYEAVSLEQLLETGLCCWAEWIYLWSTEGWLVTRRWSPDLVDWQHTTADWCGFRRLADVADATQEPGAD